MSRTVLSIFRHEPKSLGGIEAFARELSRQLASIGWRSVLVFSGPLSPDARRFIEVPDTDVAVIDRCGQMAFRPVLHIAGLLAEVRPQIVHLHFIEARSGYPWLAKLISADQIFLTEHISRPAGYRWVRQGWWRRTIRRILHLPLTGIVCVSSFVERCIQEQEFLPGGRLAVVYNGVDLDRAASGSARRHEFRRQHGIADDHIMVLQAGFLIPEKGIDDLLCAARRVVTANERIRFVIAGDSPRRVEYEKTVGELGIARNVTFLGQVRDPLGEGLYAAADIVCQVSRWEEAFGFTIAESMAAGKPVIGTRVGGIPEVVADNESGYLVARGDHAAMAERIQRLAEDQVLRESMGCAGRRICQAKFDLARNVASLIGHYGLREARSHGRVSTNEVFHT